MSSARLFVRGLDAALEGAGLPYGYTLTIWASGQLMIDRHDKPGVAAVFGVVLAAVAAFGVLKYVAYGVPSKVSASQLASDRHPIRTGVLHVATIGAAVGSVALISLIGSDVVWPLGGFVATIVYLSGSGAGMALHERDELQAGDTASLE